MPRGFDERFDDTFLHPPGTPLPYGRNPVFYRVAVDNVQAGGSRITWLVSDSFEGPSPWVFQLQVSETGVDGAADWTNVGAPLTDAFVTYDTVARDFAVQPLTHYRIVLTDAANETHISPAEPCLGRLHRADWLRARAMVRRELLQHKRRGGDPGWLLKKKRRTPISTNPQIVDPLSGRVIKTRNTGAVGTARPGGYFTPVAFAMAPVAAGPRGIQQDDNRGSIDDQGLLCSAIGFPQLDREDVWISATGDARYAVDSIKPVAFVRHIPIIVQVTLSRIAATDPIYEIALPDLPPLQTLGRTDV
jgi:hypothetical protein